MDFTKYGLIILCQLLFLKSVRLQTSVGDSCILSHNGQPGICKPVKECLSAKRQYDLDRTRPTWCSYGGLMPVCCTDGLEKRISEIKCEEYSKQVTTVIGALPLLPNADPIQVTVENCEFGSIELIVGGTRAKNGEFPHMAAIGWETYEDGKYKWYCGGSLISNNFVLTAYHCLYTNNPEVSNPEPTIVRLGELNLSPGANGVYQEDFKIKEFIKHPDYKPPEKYNDIALLKLERSVRPNKFIRPACLWSKPTFSDDRAIATGWGVTKSNSRDQSNVLLRVNLEIINKRTCQRFYPVSNRLPKGIVDTQLCAGDLSGGRDTCQGDSGGPLQTISKSNQCVYNLIGVTSFGNKCGAANSAGVYTKVSTHIDWIERNVWPNGN